MKRYVSLGISKVRYDEKKRKIVKTEAYEIGNGNIRIRREMERRQLVDFAKFGVLIATIRIKNGYDFDILEAVEPVQIRGNIYLRVNGGEEAGDDLGEIPRL